MGSQTLYDVTQGTRHLTSTTVRSAPSATKPPCLCRSSATKRGEAANREFSPLFTAGSLEGEFFLELRVDFFTRERQFSQTSGGRKAEQKVKAKKKKKAKKKGKQSGCGDVRFHGCPNVAVASVAGSR